MGTAGALVQAAPLLDSDLALVLNGDSIFYADLEAFYAWHLAAGSPATLMLAQVQDVARFGQVQFDERGYLLGFDEKGSRSGPGWINSGIYLLSRNLLESLPDQRPLSLEREGFPSWIGRGLRAYPAQGSFLDIGTPESYRQAEDFIARSAHD